jgi:nucleotide-binding universal stress UspA family protein
MDLQRVLVPVDFSELSALALRYAAQLKRCGSARLIVAYAHSFDPPPYFTEGLLDTLNTQFRQSLDQAEAALRSFAGKQLSLEDATVAEFRVLEAAPADAIRRLTRDVAADLVVMGTHGRSGVNRMMLGSVAERVVRESEAPVLTVRGDTAARVSPPHNILCPVNDTAAARGALAAAAGFAHCFGGIVTALHAKDASNEIPNLRAWIPDSIRAQCEIREVVRQGEAASEIVALARETACDLLVIGAEHRLFFDATVLGSTAARVVRHAPCPVLTVISRASGVSSSSA